MSKQKNFNIGKAQQLCLVYKKKRQYSKAQLVSKLIEWQHFFGTQSIVGVKISLCDCYRRKTVETVLKDLGYELEPDSFSNPIQRGLYGVTYGRDTNFSFREASSDATK